MKTGKLNFIIMALFCLLVVPMVLSGCVLTSDKEIITQSANKSMPDISGAFTSDSKETYTLALISGTTNAFTAVAPDKSELILTFEPLKGDGRYVVQVKNPSEVTVLFTICTIKDRQIQVYDLNIEALPPLAKKHGVTLNEGNKIAGYSSDKKLWAFFEECFDSKYSAIATTIGARS